MAAKLHSVDTFKNTLTTARRLLALAWGEDKGLVIGSFITILIPGIVPFVNAFIYAQIINLLVASLAGHAQPAGSLYLLIGARVFMLFVQGMMYIFQRRGFMAISTKVPLIITQRLMQQVDRLDIATLEDSDFQDKLQNAKENASWQASNMLQNLFYAVQAIAEMLIALVSLLFLNWIFALIVTLTAIPTLLYQTRTARAVWNIWSSNTPFRKRYNYLYYTLQNARSVKELRLFNLGGYFVDKTQHLGEKFARENMAAINKDNGMAVLTDGIGVVGYGIVEVYLLLRVLAHGLSLGSLTYYTTALTNYQNAVSGFFRTMSQLLDETQYIAEVFALLDMQPQTSSPRDGVVPANRAPLIEFRNVSFAYPGSDTEVLHNFSLIIRPGEKVAFVGENGAGKTTIIKLLCRFYDVTAGEILIDGVNIKQLDLVSWYDRLGVLFQDFLRYEYSLRDNIRFGRVRRPLISEDIVKAAAEGGADTVADTLPQGYRQMLGKTFKGGIEPSGGQWQKIALARAFYRNAPVLILDEPTASIDARAEHEIFRRVEKLASDKTVFIISHRFSTVRNADKIYVIEQGKIAESGSHKELMKLNGLYADLFNLQAAAYK